MPSSSSCLQHSRLTQFSLCILQATPPPSLPHLWSPRLQCQLYSGCPQWLSVPHWWRGALLGVLVFDFRTSLIFMQGSLTIWAGCQVVSIGGVCVGGVLLGFEFLLFVWIFQFLTFSCSAGKCQRQGLNYFLSEAQQAHLVQINSSPTPQKSPEIIPHHSLWSLQVSSPCFLPFSPSDTEPLTFTNTPLGVFCH